MAFEMIKNFFEENGLGNRVHEFSQSSATVELAAEALGCQPEWIAKTLSFKADDKPILIVTAGDAKIDNKKYKEIFGTKAVMLKPEEVESELGLSIGGVCPFLIKRNIPIYLDVSLKRFETVYPACGSSNSAVELTIPELEKFSGFKEWIDVCKGWE